MIFAAVFVCSAIDLQAGEENNSFVDTLGGPDGADAALAACNDNVGKEAETTLYTKEGKKKVNHISTNPEGTALVLEGGGLRGVYASGVLRYFMDRNIRFPCVIGVSMGACNGANYVSLQPERNRIVNIRYANDRRYLTAFPCAAGVLPRPVFHGRRHIRFHSGGKERRRRFLENSHALS